MTDVTDATFETEVLARSDEVPVVVDLWAPWCGPCKTLGPILERTIAATNGSVVLAKVNVDENPQVSASFRVQSIPAVYAIRDRQIVDGFVGAQPERFVQEFVAKLSSPPASEADQLVALGDETSLRKALELEPGHAGAVVKLAELLVNRGETEEALQLLSRIPETPEARQVAARARLGVAAYPSDGYEARLDALLERVREDEDARKEFLDLLELLDVNDPRKLKYRRALTNRLF